MSKIVEYKILRSNNAAQIEWDLNKFIEKGYQPYGTLAVVVGINIMDLLYFHAVVKYE
jgi:hypothetical protein